MSQLIKAFPLLKSTRKIKEKEKIRKEMEPYEHELMKLALNARYVFYLRSDSLIKRDKRIRKSHHGIFVLKDDIYKQMVHVLTVLKKEPPCVHLV